MLTSVSNYFYERRHGFARATGYAGAIYLAGSYVKNYLENVKDKVFLERRARDNLRRWFENNQQNVSFTIMALLPTIGEYIVAGMDVEGLTKDLQEKSREARQARVSRVISSDPSPARPDQDSRSDMCSSVVSSVLDDGSSMQASTTLGESTHSWVQDFSANGDTSRRDSSSGGGDSKDSPGSSSLENSMTESNGTSSAHSDTSSAIVAAKTKVELWKEVKILTFTRTLTTLYSLTLLSLFTHIQLNLLGRSKYIQSVLEQEREEALQEQFELSLNSLFWSHGNEESEESLLQDVDAIDEDTERKYLTLSWWICHIGWKDVGERVRRGVEEVFEEVSLKKKLGAMELHQLVCDVRRRVEHEITFEGLERKINFMSTLLPPTPDSMQHVLIQGGISQSLAMQSSPAFDSLLEETRSLLSSSDFSVVLEVCLDRATEILFDGLKKNVFIEAGSNTDEHGEEIKLRLAGLLPGMAKWSHLALLGFPNELIDGLAEVREVEAFSAIIYSRFEDRFR